jgi:hypothetical protein
MVLGRLFKWLLLVIKTRKEDIIRRKALYVKACERKAATLDAIAARLTKKQTDLQDAEDKFKEDHKDEIEAYYKYE